jgi:hypothetical protein
VFGNADGKSWETQKIIHAISLIQKLEYEKA